ncbi:SDR family oxidoreductase [Frankia sp. Cr2]|uniref:SDR family NAD(P)-dependent oxidoreductase n=1 Tax=Frankia sp. Cr2 TaxID=3073932 RepID=UPI002AD414E0|nr:SDR family oxidoreductase [Frankia sp. Cr2]
MALDGKVIAVTGVTTGIGRAAARSFARQGALVVGVGRRSDRGEQVAAALRAEGHSMIFVTGDVTRPDECTRFIDTAITAHGRVDALVNNVGGSGTPTYVPTVDVTPAQFDESVALNLRSAFFCSQAAVKHMRTAGGGAIVNVSSCVGTQAMATQVVYAISKAALDHLTRCLAVEYLEDGIRVNTVVIGGAMTKQSARALSEVAAATHRPVPTAETLPDAVQGTDMDSIVDALAFLCSDASRGVTATAVAVDRARSAGAVFSAALLDALGGRWNR